jgi:hypothetical protein
MQPLYNRIVLHIVGTSQKTSGIFGGYYEKNKGAVASTADVFLNHAPEYPSMTTVAKRSAKRHEKGTGKRKKWLKTMRFSTINGGKIG